MPWSLTWMVLWDTYFDGILPKGPYPPCLRMADRALWQDTLDLYMQIGSSLVPDPDLMMSLGHSAWSFFWWMDTLVSNYAPRTTKLLGVYFFKLSICLTVSFHIIRLIKQLQKMFLANSQNLNLWQLFKICNLFWLWIWCESLVWVIVVVVVVVVVGGGGGGGWFSEHRRSSFIWNLNYFDDFYPSMSFNRIFYYIVIYPSSF